MQESRVTAMSVIVAVGGLANLLLALCLAHTWRHWRQVKWYVLMLALGNLLQVFFTFGADLGISVSGTWAGTSGTCRLLVLLTTLGPSLAAMAVAALALHVLLTVLTGSQGDRTRHVLVLGLFVLLSLPLPLSKVGLFQTLDVGGGRQMCTTLLGPEEQYKFLIGIAVALVYFPVFVLLACGVASLFLMVAARRGPFGDVKGDESASDLVICGLLGGVTIVCCVPLYTFWLVHFGSTSMSMYDVARGLNYLEYCRNIITAVVAVVFAYVHAFRNRGEGYLDPGGQSMAGGERQKLVN